MLSRTHRRTIHVFSAKYEYNTQMKEQRMRGKCTLKFSMAEWDSWNGGCIGTGLRRKRASVSKHRMDYNGAQDFRTNDYEVDAAAASVDVASCAERMRTLCVFVPFFVSASPRNGIR